MADNANLTEGDGTLVSGADDIGGVKFQRIKVIHGADGVNDGDVSSSNPLPVDGSGVTQPVSGTVSVTGVATAANQATANSSLSSIDGKITAVNTGNVTIGAALPAGTNAIGKLASNTGVTIGAVEIASSQTLATVTNVATIGTSVTPGTSAAHLGKAEDAAHTSGDTGVMALGVRNDAMATLTSTDGDYSPIAVSSTGRLFVTPAPSASMVRGTASVAGTSDTSLVAASGSGSLKTYITNLSFANTGSSNTLITLKDGSGGSTLWYTIAPAGSGSNIQLEIPIVTSANTALYFACGTSSTTVYASATGYKAP